MCWIGFFNSAFKLAFVTAYRKIRFLNFMFEIGIKMSTLKIRFSNSKRHHTKRFDLFISCL